MDSVLTLVLNRWRRLNGWIMFVENAVFALCLDLADHAGSWLMPDPKTGIFAQILAFKIALSLVSDFAQNRRRWSSTKEITLAAGMATLRGVGTCIALAFLSYNHTYILRFLIDPFMLLTIFDVVICLALFQHLRWAPFIIPVENVILLATRMPAHEPPYFPTSIAVLAYFFVKGIGSAAAMALDFRKGNRPVHRITIWQIAWPLRA